MWITQPYLNLFVCEMKTNHKTRKWGFKYCFLILWIILKEQICLWVTLRLLDLSQLYITLNFLPPLSWELNTCQLFSMIKSTFAEQTLQFWQIQHLIGAYLYGFPQLLFTPLSLLSCQVCLHLWGQAWGAALSPGERGVLSTHMFITPELRSCWVRSV